VNLALDELLRAAQDPDFRDAAGAAPEAAAKRAGVTIGGLTAVLNGDLAVLYEYGAHPLLIMQLAAALEIDPMDRLGGHAAAPAQTERSTGHEDHAGRRQV
jgi:hypothetical protein